MRVTYSKEASQPDLFSVGMNGFCFARWRLQGYVKVPKSSQSWLANAKAHSILSLRVHGSKLKNRDRQRCLNQHAQVIRMLKKVLFC
jgi:hypothetical protein